MYLGDGCLARLPRTYQLVISCDSRLPAIVEEVSAAILATGLSRHVGRYKMPNCHCIRVVGASQRWPEAFPQHGPGRKHERRILLETWQQAIVDEHPWLFLRGLLQSDGCRTLNRFCTTLPSGRVAEYAYPRWFFSNRSDDIRSLFCATCDAVGVRWTLSNARNVSVAQRRSVALLDEHIGLKR
jgi:hypothetical protein